MPDGFKAGWGSNMHMYLCWMLVLNMLTEVLETNIMEKFNNRLWFDIEEVYLCKDPRYLATLFTPEEIFQGREVWFHNLSVGNAAMVLKVELINHVPQRAPVRNRNRGGRLSKRIDEALNFHHLVRTKHHR